MGQKKQTKLEDIARELGISIVSVSNALKDKKGVGEELRLKVKEKAQQMGYLLPQTSVKKETKTYCIGVIIAERYVKEFPSFYMDVYKQIAQVAAKKGSLTLLEIVDSGKEELKYPAHFFPNMGVDGILFVGEMRIGFIREVRKNMEIPAVGVDFYNLEENMDYIVTDSLHGMQRVTQRLIDAGHRDIAFLGNPHATKSIMDRYMGYCKALKINGMKERPERILPDRKDGLENPLIDFELPEDMPTAFAVNCDKSAYILIEKLHEKGLRVPEDVSVVSFDHLNTTIFEDISLTTYESDEKALAQIGVHTLMKKMEGKNTSANGTEGIRIVEGRLFEGNTVKKLNGEKREKICVSAASANLESTIKQNPASLDSQK